MLEGSNSLRTLSLENNSKRYMPGLDGLRALSVLAVIAYHLKIHFAPGGLLGVGVFFTLSGYLITDQLMTEWHSAGRIDFINFWKRRMRRLLPAMFLVLITVALWLYYFDRPRLISLQGDFLSVLFYFNNWWLIFHEVSYFESFGPPSPLGHLWSLAIEEQFYLLWPLVLVLILRWIPRRNSRVFAILVGAAASALAMALIYETGTDPSRVYYGTDTRAFALLIGAALALVWPSRSLSAQVDTRVRVGLEVTGILGLTAIILMVIHTHGSDPRLYTYGLTLFAVISALVIAVLAHPASLLAKVVGCQPLRWIGIRSYGLYLWHYPVIILTSPIVDTGGFNPGRAVIQVALCFILAAFSWRFIEEPIQKGHFTFRPRKTSRGKTLNPRHVLAGALCIFIIMVMPGSDSFMPDKKQDSPSVLAEEIFNKRLLSIGTTADLPAGSQKNTLPPVSQAKNEPLLNTEVHSGEGVTAIGDSVLLDVAPELDRLLPGILIDGKIGRQMTQAQAIVNSLKEQGRLGNIVVIELGTNGAFSQEELNFLLISLKDVERIILINTRVPRMWQDKVNADLKQAALNTPNAVLVDWYSASKDRDSFFSPDGVHLTPEGSKYYAALLSQAIIE